MDRTDFGTLWEKARVRCFERTALKQIYYQGWNRITSPGWMHEMQVYKAGALGRPRGMGWGGKWEGGSGWGTHVDPWLIHVNIWQKSLQYCKVISPQLIKINEKKKIQTITSAKMINRYQIAWKFLPNTCHGTAETGNTYSSYFPQFNYT